MVSLSETGSWKSSRRVFGGKGILSTNTTLGGPDGCVSERLRLALGKVLLWPSPADDGGGFRLFWRRFLVARNARSTGFVGSGAKARSGGSVAPDHDTAPLPGWGAP